MSLWQDFSTWFHHPPSHGTGVRDHIERSRSIDIARCLDGHRHRITGVIEGANTLVAPLTRRRCLYWSVSIDEVGQGDFVERGTTDQGTAFLLRDASGLARVMPEGARLALPPLTTVFPPPWSLPEPELAVFQQLQPHMKFNWPRTSSLRFNERRLLAGEQITIVGLNQREPGDNASETDADVSGYRGELATRPVFSSSRRMPLLIGMNPKNQL